MAQALERNLFALLPALLRPHLPVGRGLAQEESADSFTEHRAEERPADEFVGVGRHLDEMDDLANGSVDLGTNNAHSHITISCADGVKPVYSNTLLALPAEEVEQRLYVVKLSGVLHFEKFQK